MGSKRNLMKIALIHMESLAFSILPIKENKIVISNFFGVSYDGNPKYITEQLIKESDSYDLVWVVSDYKEDIPKCVRQVKYGTIQASYEFATARLWIDSVRNFYKGIKKKNQLYLQTWHGSFMVKLVEGQTEGSLSRSYIKKAKYDGKITDGIIAGTGMQSEVFKKYFWLGDKAEILTTGSPRNDMFFNSEYEGKIREKIHRYFSVPDSCKIIIYMPTFRDNNNNSVYKFDYKKVLETFQVKFKTNCKLIIRLHPNVKEYAAAIEYNSQILNGSLYPDSEELCIASDYMITDYSSSFYEFLLLRRPVFLFTQDYYEYKNLRGLNNQYDKLPFSKSDTEDELINNILCFDEKLYFSELNDFMEQIHSFDDGNASSKVTEWIARKMKVNEIVK